MATGENGVIAFYDDGTWAYRLSTDLAGLRRGNTRIVSLVCLQAGGAGGSQGATILTGADVLIAVRSGGAIVFHDLVKSPESAREHVFEEDSFASSLNLAFPSPAHAACAATEFSLYSMADGAAYQDLQARAFAAISTVKAAAAPANGSY